VGAAQLRSGDPGGGDELPRGRRCAGLRVLAHRVDLGAIAGRQHDAGRGVLGQTLERGREALAAIRRNLAATGFASRATVVPRPVRAYLDAAPPGAFGVVFVDPPFADVATMNETLAHPALRGALAPGAIVIARSLRKHPASPPADASVVRTKPIGEEDLVFLRYSQPAAGGSLWTSSSS
jgi:hypothetical protein